MFTEEEIEKIVYDHLVTKGLGSGVIHDTDSCIQFFETGGLETEEKYIVKEKRHKIEHRNGYVLVRYYESNPWE